jgi:hypothetical protein
MDGYGNDTTSSSSDQSGGSDIAGSIAQIFSTGVTAYVDSQAIQRGYQINNPQYYAGGYPGGVSNPYGATPAGASIVPPGGALGSSSSLMLLLVIGLVAFVALRKA